MTDATAPSTDSFPTGPPVTKGVHVCPICSKQFKRSEHCARHQFSHRKERPFPCRFCGKTYARKDLVKRHEQTIHAQEYAGFIASRDASAPSARSAARRTESVSAAAAPGRSPPSRDPVLPETTIQDFAAQDRAVVPSPAAAASREGQTTRASRSGATDPSVSDANSPTSPHSTESATGRKRRYNSISHDGDNRIDYSKPQSPGAASMANMGPMDITMDEIICSNVVQRDPGELSSAMRENEQTLQLTSSTDVSQNRHTRVGSDALSGPACEAGQTFGTQTSTSADQGIFMDSLLFPDCTFVPMGNGAMVGQGLDIQQQNAFSWHRTLPAFPDFSSQTPQFGATEETLLTPESSGDVDHAKQPWDVATRVPRIVKNESVKRHRLVIDENAYNALFLDACSRLEGTGETFPIKSCRELQHLINGYVDCFHRHFPILHLASMVPAETPSPLISAMCCIGALYRLERTKARRLYRATMQMLASPADDWGPPIQMDSTGSGSQRPQEEVQSKGATLMMPLWLLQSRVLNSFYASLGEDESVAVAEFDKLGMFSKEYRLRRDYLRRSEESGGRFWKDWVERESLKRLLCGLFIQSNLLVVLYDITPGFDINQDLDFPVLEDERLWDVSTAEEWYPLRQMTTPPSQTIQGVLLDILQGSNDEVLATEPYYISRFTALVVMHAVNVHVWHLNQVSRTLKQSMQAADYPTNALISHTLTMLSRCRDILRHHQPGGVEPSWDENREGPLLFNYEAMLRVAYIRLFTDVSVPQKFTLLIASKEDKLAALKRFVAAKQERSPLMTKAVAYAFDSFFIPIQMGYLLVQKTAAFSWSVETAVSAWGCAILLCKWIHCIETLGAQGAPLEAETRLIKQVKSALEDMDSSYEEGRSLAAAVAGAWAIFLNDVWVWGITARLGQNLVELSHLYESSYKEHQERQLWGMGD
ncbi:hypothetical protein SCAR479_08232 [Seiridium cardinale]|uniref:C2H2-type domain-containing protein n=1 Tax=Seiridium cardinale TaxID=138064 RepID=A0ABR2XMC0_9PEZI